MRRLGRARSPPASVRRERAGARGRRKARRRRRALRAVERRPRRCRPVDESSTISTGRRRPIRSRRPMRCSTVAGFHGRSKSTSRLQNSKLRPSPPASVDTNRLGPSGLRKSATSVSRRAADELFVECASCQLRAVTERRAQHFQRFPVCDENERLLVGVHPAPRLCEQPREAGVRYVHRVCLLAQRRFVRSKDGAQRCARREPTTDAVDLLALRNCVHRGRGSSVVST